MKPTLKEQMDPIFKRWLAKGKKMTAYLCNHCQQEIPTQQPGKGDVSSKGYWDSVMTCLECGKHNFVLVYPTGETVSRKMPF